MSGNPTPLPYLGRGLVDRGHGFDKGAIYLPQGAHGAKRAIRYAWFLTVTCLFLAVTAKAAALRLLAETRIVGLDLNGSFGYTIGESGVREARCKSATTP